jgi:integrase
MAPRPFVKAGKIVVAKLELTQDLVDGLDFHRMITGTTKTGRPIFGETPPGKHDWIVRDGGHGGQPGLLLRVTPGAITWCVQKKVKGTPLRRKIGSARKVDGHNEVELTVAKARTRARLWLADMERGEDPLKKKEDHQRQAKKASEERRITLAVAMGELIETKRLHKVQLAGLENGLKAAGPGKRRTVDPKLRDESTKDRQTVQRWLTGSPMWSVPIKDLGVEHIRASLTPLLDRAMGRKVKITWGPKSVSKGTMDKIYAHVSAAWKLAARKLQLGVAREDGPLALWREEMKSSWPKGGVVKHALETDTSEGVAWVKALVELQTRAHDPALFAQRPDPRSKGLKPHTGAMVDLYFLLLLWGTREGETSLLEWPQVHFDRGLVYLNADTTKNARLDVVPLTTWASDILRKRQAMNELWRPESGCPFVFPSREWGKPISNPRGILTSLTKATGLTITAYDLRRSMAREIGDEHDLANAAKLLIKGAALHHGAGRGGTRALAVTERYLGEKADVLRPLYQQREDRLREMLGLKVKPAPTSSGDELGVLLQRMREDQLKLEALMKGRG